MLQKKYEYRKQNDKLGALLSIFTPKYLITLCLSGTSTYGSAELYFDSTLTSGKLCIFMCP